MLKGHVFSKQLFEHPIFALFVNTFLDGRNGISNNYKEGMKLSYSGNTITINSGAACIQGRFVEETLHSQVVTGNDNSFCKLVIEIDLNKQNTESEFLQAQYKIIKSSANYPTLTQNNIVKNNAGIYQYELARFKTGNSGITNFEDKRTFLDLQSILNLMEKEFEKFLAEFQSKINSVQDGSGYILKDDYAIIEGIMRLTGEAEGKQTSWEIDFPEGFNQENCTCLAFETKIIKTNGYANGTGFSDAMGLYSGDIPRSIIVGRSNSDSISKIWCQTFNVGTDTIEVRYRIVLMKYKNQEQESKLGDVNGDGVINQADYDMLQKFLVGEITLLKQQYIAADINKDGNVTMTDLVKLKEMINNA